MIKIMKLANALNSMVVEPEKGAARKTNLLSPNLSSLWGREGEERNRKNDNATKKKETRT